MKNKGLSANLCTASEIRTKSNKTTKQQQILYLGDIAGMFEQLHYKRQIINMTTIFKRTPSQNCTSDTVVYHFLELQSSTQYVIKFGWMDKRET